MISEEKKKVLEYFKAGRAFYKERKFESALKQFENALKIDREDGPSKVYYARCKVYIQTPPPENWDGVFVMKTK